MPTLTAPPASSPPRATKPPPAFTLAEHLEELRRRLGISLGALLVAVGVSFTQADRLIEWLRRPVESALPRFAFFSPTEPLAAYLHVSVLAGLALAMPVMLWQCWLFIRSGLTGRERALGLAFVGWGTCQFLAGILAAYFVLLPVSLRFLLGIGRAQFEPVISVGRYLSFVTTLTLWCGLVFELPVVLFLLARVGIVTPEWLRQQRSYAVLVLVIVAALATPTTDPVNLLLLAAPLVLLYEISIIVARCATTAVSPRRR